MEYKHSYHHNAKEVLGLSVYSAGSQQCVPGQSWGPAVRDHYLLHYVSAGKGVYVCGGREYPIVAGEAFVIYPGELVTYRPDDREPWEYHWVGFVGAEAKEQLRLCGFSRSQPVNTLPGSTVVEDLRRIYAANGPSPAAEAEMVGRLWLFFAHCIREDPRPAPAAEPDYLAQALRYIRGNFAEDFSILQLAEHVGVSRSQLYRAFETRFDQSPQAFLQQYRIREAAALLTSTDLSVEEVAASTGFRDPLYFSRVFRREKGRSPRTYRAEHTQREE